MAEHGSLYQTLQGIAGRSPWKKGAEDRSASDGTLEGRQVFCGEIFKSVLAFADEVSTEEGSSEANIDQNGFPELSPGSLAGRAMAQELQGEDLSVQIFFEAHKMVRTFLLEEFGRSVGEGDRARKWFVILESFMGDLAAGFVLEKMWVVKTVSRRRQQEAKRYILQEKKRYAAIFYQMEEPSFVVDSDMRLVDANPACEKFFGKSSAEIIGSQCCDVIGPKFCGECPLKETIDTGKSFSNFKINLPVRTVAEEGGEEGRDSKTLLLAGAALKGVGSDSASSGGIVIIQDITKRKKIELELDEYRDWLEDLVDDRTEELINTNESLQKEIRDRLKVERELIQTSADLKRSNADLEQFAQVASHDLREPLMLVASFSERMVQGYSDILDERGRNYLQRIVKATRKLQELVEALLQLSKVSTSAGRFETLDMNELVRDVVGVLGEQINRAGARVEVAQLHDLNGDSIQMQQLFQNVISNALKYYREGVAPSVIITSRIVGDVCEISVEDNGIGLNEENVKRIFEPFVRLHSRDVYDGSGMGLTTCQKIVNRHGGEILARSKPGDGAVFVIRLPIRH